MISAIGPVQIHRGAVEAFAAEGRLVVVGELHVTDIGEDVFDFEGQRERLDPAAGVVSDFLNDGNVVGTDSPFLRCGAPCATRHHFGICGRGNLHRPPP